MAPIMTRFAARLLFLATLALAGTFLFATPGAIAQESSCQTDFQKFGKARQAALERINSFGKRKVTATQVCAAAGQLVSADTKLIEWMTANKDWCQVPEEAINNLTNGRAQGVALRTRACGAAAQEKKLQAQARRQQQEAAGGGGALAPQPGSGVRLPQGAL